MRSASLPGHRASIRPSDRAHGFRIVGGGSAVLAAAVLLRAEAIRRAALAADTVMHPDPQWYATPEAAARLDGGDPGTVIAPEPWDVGTGVTGWVWRAPSTRGAVLLQHGWGDFTSRWAQQAAGLIPHLLQAGFDVHGFDLRGCGRSSGRRGVVDVERAVRDHLAARALLRRRSLPVHLIGHSLGGLVTATSVVRDPRDVASVVLLAPAVKYDIGPVLRGVVRAGAFLAPNAPAPLAEGGIEQLTSIPSVNRRLLDEPMLHRGRVPWLTAAGGAVVSHRNWHRYRQVTVPVLAIHGSDDESTDPTGSTELIGAVRSEDKQAVLVPGVRHLMLDDVRADETRDRIIDWVAARTPS